MPNIRPLLFRPLLFVSMIAVVVGFADPARAADLVIGQGGRVTVELLTSDAAFHNSLSVTGPAGVALAASGCKLEAISGLGGVRLVSEKTAVHGCRAQLDSDGGTGGIQGFAAGATLRFNMCAQADTDADCEFVWSSNDADNSDGLEHVHITELRAGDFPGRIYQLAWEDTSGGGDNDFNDITVVVRVDLDSDGDGLWDDWERFGADLDGDGAIDLDLPAAGARWTTRTCSSRSTGWTARSPAPTAPPVTRTATAPRPPRSPPR